MKLKLGPISTNRYSVRMSSETQGMTRSAVIRSNAFAGMLPGFRMAE
jgi:hypothetical protein